jgi:hypothetical protein
MADFLDSEAEESEVRLLQMLHEVTFSGIQEIVYM